METGSEDFRSNCSLRGVDDSVLDSGIYLSGWFYLPFISGSWPLTYHVEVLYIRGALDQA